MDRESAVQVSTERTCEYWQVFCTWSHLGGHSVSFLITDGVFKSSIIYLFLPFRHESSWSYDPRDGSGGGCLLCYVCDSAGTWSLVSRHGCPTLRQATSPLPQMQAALKPAVFREHRPPALHLTKDMAAAGAAPRVQSRRERPCAMCVFDERFAIAWPDVHPKKAICQPTCLGQVRAPETSQAAH